MRGETEGGAEWVIDAHDQPAPEPTSDDAVEVRLLALDVPLYSSLERQYHELRRELRLLSLSHQSDYPLAGDLTSMFANFERQFPGVRLRDSYLRTYPEGRLAAHILGGTGKISAEEVDGYRRRGYEGNETVGKGGIEQEYESVLRGAPGSYTREVDASGEPILAA